MQFNGVIEIYPGLTVVAMVMKFGNFDKKLAITQIT